MIRSIASIFGTRVWSSLSGMVLYLALARRMGPELQGVVSFATMLVALLVMGAGLGFDSSAVYFLNRVGMQSRRYLRRIAPALAAGALLAGGLLTALHFTGSLGLDRSGEPFVYALVLALFPLDMLLQLARYLFLARERISDYNRIDRLQALVLLLAVGTALVLRPDSVAWVLAGYLTARLTVLASVVASLRRQPLDLPDAEGPERTLGDVLRYSVFPWIGNFLAVLGVRLDTVLVAWFAVRSPAVSAADLGYYTVCMMALSRLQDLQMAVQNAYFPRVASLPLDEARALAARFFRLSWLLYLGVLLAVLAGGLPVLSAFGPGYSSAFPAFATMAVGMLALRANTGVLALYFTSIGKPQLPVRVNAAATAASLLLGLLLIPRLGILGAALANFGACLTAKLAIVWIFAGSPAGWWRELRLRRSDLRDVRDWFRDKLRTHRRSPWRRDSA